MKKGSLAALVMILAGTGVGLAQSPSAVETYNLTPADTTRAELAPADRPVTPYLSAPLGPQNGAPLLSDAPHNGRCDMPHYDGTEVVWLSADYLLLWIKDGPLHTPLITTGSQTTLGVLGNSDTSVVFGDKDIDYHALSGLRLTGGFWFGRDACWGLEASGFFTEHKVENFSVASATDGTPVLARPVIDARTGLETAELISAPNIVSGNMSVHSSSDLYGWELNLINRLSKSRETRFELLAGVKSVSLEESLNMVQNSTLSSQATAGFVGGVVVPPGTLHIQDQFQNRNDSYGPQIGARAELGGGSFFVNFSAKVALGVSHETSNIFGTTSNIAAGTSTVTAAGGLLALTPNGGHSTNDEFAVVPEFNLNVGYKITPLWRIYVGYNFLYWSDVARPGDQINRTINPAFVPTSQLFGTTTIPFQPVHEFRNTDFWAQGMNFGMELRY